jgi:hypothetical protein
MQAETHNALAIIVKQLDDKILQLQEFISTGNLDKFEEYKKVCGEINGLLTARNYIIDLNKNMENSDE